MTDSDLAAFLVSLPSAVPELSDLDGRIHPSAAPKGSDNPRLVYQLADGDMARHLAGGGDRSFVFLVRVFAETRAQAAALRFALAEVLQGRLVTTPQGRAASDFAGWEDGYDEEAADHIALALWRVDPTS